MPNDLIDAVDSWPLRSAVISGDIEVVRKNLGLDEGARIDEEDKLGQTPLYCAIKERNTEIAELLLKHGCNVNVKTKEGESPLHLAAYRGLLKIVKCLLEYGG